MPVVTREKEFHSLVPPKVKKEKAPKPVDVGPSGPCLYIHEVEVPELNRMKVGDTFTATIKGKLVSTSQRDSERGGSRRSYDVEVQAISFE